MFHVKHRGADGGQAALEKSVSRETSGCFTAAGPENAILQNNPMH